MDLQHVQADELWVKLVGQRAWLAMALAAPSRLWLGGVISPQRDKQLITALVSQVRACAAALGILVCVDGLAASVTAFGRVFSEPARTGRRGRPRLVVEPGLLIGQVVKRYTQRRVVSTSQRVVRGTAAAIAAVLAATVTGAGIHTAYIERLNATFRSHLAPLVRRGRAIAHTLATLEAGMWLVGTSYNLCWPHDRLRAKAPAGRGRTWLARTPAMAAGLTDHPWTLRDVLWYRVPLPACPNSIGQRAPDAVPRLSQRPLVRCATPPDGPRRRRPGLYGVPRQHRPRQGRLGYVGDGTSRWPAVHRLDAARLFRLALELENTPAGSVLHAVADEGVPIRTIAEVIGRHLDLPVVAISPDDAGEHFGFLGGLLAMDSPASSASTRERMPWQPTQPGLIDDLEQGYYFNN